MKYMGFQEELCGHSGCVNRLAWNENGTFLASVSDDTNIILWPFPTGKPYKISSLHTNNIFGVSFLPQSNSSSLVTGGLDSCVSLHRITEAGGTLEQMHVSTSGREGRGEPDQLVAHTAKFKCHLASVNDIEVSQHDPNLAWSASTDSTVRQFDFRTPKSQQDSPESANVLISLSKNVPAHSTWSMDSGISSVRVNPIRPEMIAVGFDSDDVFLFDRRKLGLTTKPSFPCHDMNTEPMLVLRCPFNLGGDQNAALDLQPTYVSFGNRGDKLVASYKSGPAVAWSTLNSAEAGAALLRPHFDIEKSMAPVQFFGAENHVDVERSNYICDRCEEERKPSYGLDYKLRMLKKALAENPYDYRTHCELIAEYMDRKPCLENLFATLLHSEYFLRFAPAYLFEPYFAVLMGLHGFDLSLAALYMIQHIHRKFNGKSKEYHEKTAQDTFKSLEKKLRTLSKNIYKTKDLDELMKKALAGDIDIDYWVKKQLPNSKTPTSNLRDQLMYMKACGISYIEKKPYPLFCQGYLEPNYLQSYTYHSNSKTGIKEAVFFGSDDSYIICGSDSGLAIIYEAGSGEIAQVVRGDTQICNCIRPHPTKPMFATSGLNSSVKIWSSNFQHPDTIFEGHTETVNQLLTTISEFEERSEFSPGFPDIASGGLPTFDQLEDLYNSMMETGDPEARWRLQMELISQLEDRYSGEYDHELDGEDLYDYYDDSESE